MLESIISPGTAERSPWDMIIVGVLVSSVAIWMGHYLAGSLGVSPSMLSLAITVMALAPLMHHLISVEEEVEERAKHDSPAGFLLRHVCVLSMYSFLFVGMMASFAFWYAVLPYEAGGVPSASSTFGLQESAIQGVQLEVGGTTHAIGLGAGGDISILPAKDLSPEDLAELEVLKTNCNPDVHANARTCLEIWRNRFSRLYDRNMRVMFLAFFASFLFGAGALWILTWNASVIGVFVGNKIKHDLLIGVMTPLSISLWAIPEIAAYVVAALAGGIISVAVSRHHFRSEAFWMTVFDGLLLFLIAAFLIIIGAYLEHFFVSVPCPLPY